MTLVYIVLVLGLIMVFVHPLTWMGGRELSLVSYVTKAQGEHYVKVRETNVVRFYLCYWLDSPARRS